jgi:hypothetical protein
MTLKRTKLEIQIDAEQHNLRVSETERQIKSHIGVI